MKIIKKIFFTVVIILFAVAVGLSLVVTIRHDQLADVVIKKVNDAINTKISYKSISVGFRGSFPDVSLKFNNILIRPSGGYSEAEFGRLNSDTLLYASTLAVSVDLRSLIYGKTSVSGIICRDGVAYLLTDKNGNTNFRVINSDGQSESDANIRLDHISAKNMKITYADHAADILVRGSIKNSLVAGEIFSSGIDLSARVNASLDLLEVYGFRFSKREAEANLELFKTKTAISFRKGTLKLGDLLCNLDGSVDYEHKWMELKINGSNIDLADMAERLPQKYSEMFEGIRPGGRVEFSGDIKGYYLNASVPHFDFRYNLTNGRLIYDQSGIDVNNLSLRGSITNGVKNNRQTFRFSVDTLKAALGAAYFNGSMSLENLQEPEVTLVLNGDLVFDDLRKFIKTKSFDSREGAVSGNIALHGKLPAGTKLTLASLKYLNPVANLRLDSFAADFPDMGLFFRDVSGKIRLAESLRTEDLCMTILNQKYCFNCDLGNFTGWLTGSGDILDITGNITAETFEPAAFAATQTTKPRKEQDDKPVDLFPADIRANVDFHADNLINNKFSAQDFSCNLTYKPFVLSFSNISARCLDGVLEGNFMIGRKSDGSYISKSGLLLNGIDIQKAFVAFNNFGQKFIVSDNLGGKVTGTLSLLTMVDKNFKVQTPSIVAEAHVAITNGRLIDFKPVEELSSFIDLEELKDISFSKMENDLYVKNSSLSLPKMQITSSVGSFSVYGTHSFGGDYTYHIRVALSDVLSRKAKERNRNRDDFGEIADDGLGRTSIPIKLESKNGKTDVSYDFGQSKNIVKESISEEKESLKGILNEEYGWYGGDSTVTEKAEAKPKFRITWEEGKDQANADESSATKEEKEERPLFKRKRQ